MRSGSSDFSVTYRFGGMLHEVKSVLSANSRLRTNMLDTLHADGIEIVSPTFMNTRALQPAQRVMPSPDAARAPTTPPVEKTSVEEIAFEEAEKAETLEALRARVRELEPLRKQQIEALEHARPAEKTSLQAALTKLDTRIERLKTVIHARETAKDD